MKARSSFEAVKERALAAWRLMPSLDLGDLQVIVGFAALFYGVAQFSRPLAWILFGSLLLAGWLVPRLPRAKRGD